MYFKSFIFEKIFKNRFSLTAFLVPLAVRAIPEILMAPYIVGFDPVGYYIPIVSKWLNDGAYFWEYMATAPLFYTILLGLTLLKIPITASLKIIPPLLHGFLALTIYFYANKPLSWSSKKSLLVTLLATLYFVALRISWDLLRNELGLIFLFITLTILQKDGKRLRHYLLLSLITILVVLSNHIVTIIMFFMSFLVTMRMLFDRKYVMARNLVVSYMPAALIFLLIINADYLTWPGFKLISDFPKRDSEGRLLIFGFSSYLDMVANTLGFLFYCYLPILPLTIIGLKRNRNPQLESWIIWCLIAILSQIISPSAFIPIKEEGFRWTLMLTYPLAFYASDALASLKSSTKRSIYILILITLSTGFVIGSNENSFVYYTLFLYYIPSSMLQNTVPLSECQDTVNALQWLKSNMYENACLLTHRAFYGWSYLILNENQIMPYDYGDPVKAAQSAIQKGYNRIYLIWWTNGNGWHGQPTVPTSFEEVYRSGKIAIYIYTIV